MYRITPSPAGATWKPTSLGVIASDALILTLAAVAFLLWLGHAPLSEDQTRYAAVAAEMLRTRDFIAPLVAGPSHVEQPPLLYWLTAISFALFGQTEFAARLVPALAAVASCTTLSAFFHRMRLRREARICVLVLPAMLGMALLAGVVLLDLLLMLGLTLSLAGLYLWYCSAGRSRAALRAAAVGLGLAVLCKGVVAIALVGPLIVWLAIGRSRQGEWSLRNLDKTAVGIFLSMVLASGWLAAWRHEGLARLYLLNEHLLRYPGAWIPVFPCALRESQRPTLEPFLLAWAAVPLVLFSFSEAEPDYCIVACLPPLAAWIAYRLGPLTAHGRRRADATALALAANLTVALLLSKIATSDPAGHLGMARNMLPPMRTACAVLVIAAVASPLVLLRRRN